APSRALNISLSLQQIPVQRFPSLEVILPRLGQKLRKGIFPPSALANPTIRISPWLQHASVNVGRSSWCYFNEDSGETNHTLSPGGREMLRSR
uniref:Uncharacterized protein n=1 Tax=Xiphophorus couchianus TaxID=32473 RepID=A0A3B5L352_9TELE